MSFDIYTELTLAYETEQLKQWSNPGSDTGASEPDTDRIDKAFESAKSYMRRGGGHKFDVDETDERIIEITSDIILDLTVAFLKQRAAAIVEAQALFEVCDKRLEWLRKVLHNNTIVPTYQNNDVLRGAPRDPKFTSRSLRQNGFPTQLGGREDREGYP